MESPLLLLLDLKSGKTYPLNKKSSFSLPLPLPLSLETLRFKDENEYEI